MLNSFIRKILMTNLKLNLKVDKELIIISLLVIITGIIYFFVNNQRAFLNFFYLPVLLGAFFYDRHYEDTELKFLRSLSLDELDSFSSN